MLNKMRIRMVIAGTAACLIVLILLVTAIITGNRFAVTDRIDRSLSRILEAGKPPFFQDTTRFFTVRLDSEERVTEVFTDFISSVDADSAKAYAAKVTESGNMKGYAGSFRYMVVSDGRGSVIGFLNAERELEMMAVFRRTTILIAGFSLVLVFVLLILLSRPAVMPFVRNVENQKRFITDASHELKTPLTAIGACLDAQEMENGRGVWTENIRGQIQRMGKLVNELVTLSRLDESNPSLRKEEFSFSEVCWELTEALRAGAQASGRTFDVQIADDIKVRGDRDSVQRMVSVLLDNAVRYSDSGGSIKMKLEEKGGKAVFEVFNTCSLEEAPDTARLFDRFYRPDGSRTAQSGGFGMGLAIAKAVAQAHGGKIVAICPDGKSMTIRVTL